MEISKSGVIVIILAVIALIAAIAIQIRLPSQSFMEIFEWYAFFTSALEANSLTESFYLSLGILQEGLNSINLLSNVILGLYGFSIFALIAGIYLIYKNR